MTGFVDRIGLPLCVGEARRRDGTPSGRGIEILSHDGLTVGNALPWARDEIVRIVNLHPDLFNALRSLVDAVTDDGGDEEERNERIGAAVASAVLVMQKVNGGGDA